MEDHYLTLNVAENATLEEVKQSYRQLARKFHPDKNPGNPQAEKKFKEIVKAYEVIGDAEKRARYDKVRHQISTANPFGEDMTNSPEGDDILADFNDAVADILGEAGLGDLLNFEEKQKAPEKEMTREEIIAELKKEAIADPELREYLQQMQILAEDIEL